MIFLQSCKPIFQTHFFRVYSVSLRVETTLTALPLWLLTATVDPHTVTLIESHTKFEPVHCRRARMRVWGQVRLTLMRSHHRFTAALGAGKTRTLRCGNIAGVIMYLKCWLVLPRAQHLWWTQILWPGHKKCFLNIPCFSVRGAQQCCRRVLPRAANIVGHNVAATMCPCFTAALESHRQCDEPVTVASYSSWFNFLAGHDIYGFYIKPPNMEPGTKYPCVLFVYGGPHVQVSEILVSAAAQFERNSETETRKLSSNA